MKLTSVLATAAVTLAVAVPAATAAPADRTGAVDADLAKLQSDVRADLRQLRSDLKAARDAKVDPGDLKALVQSVHELAKSDRADVRRAVQKIRAPVMALTGSAPKS